MSEWIRKLTEKYSEVNENQKAAMQKKLAKSAASSEKGKAAVTLPKAPWDKNDMKAEAKKLDPVGQADADIDNDGDVDKSDKYLHNRRKAIGKAMKKEGDEVVMNPKEKKDKNTQSSMNAESTEWKVYSRIIENRAAHIKGATPPMEADDGVSPNAKAMKKKMDSEKDINDDDEKGHDDMEKAGRAGPAGKARPNDNKSGDKSIINKPEDVTKKGGM